MIRERIFLAAALTAVLTAAGAAQSQQAAIDRLKRAERLTRTLQGSATDRMAVPLAAGQFVRIDVMQIGTDVRVIFRDPDNHIVAEVDSPTGGYGRETTLSKSAFRPVPAARAHTRSRCPRRARQRRRTGNS